MPNRFASGIRARSVDVLVVDDDADVRALFAYFLVRNGCTVRTAASAEEALAECHRFAPSVLLTDARLPGLSGAELVRAVRASVVGGGLIAVIGVTGTTEQGDLHALADEVLLKPVPLNLLGERIQVLAGRAAAKAHAR